MLSTSNAYRSCTPLPGLTLPRARMIAAALLLALAISPAASTYGQTSEVADEPSDAPADSGEVAEPTAETDEAAPSSEDTSGTDDPTEATEPTAESIQSTESDGLSPDGEAARSRTSADAPLIERLHEAYEAGGIEAVTMLVDRLPAAERAAGMEQIRLLRDRARERFGSDEHPLRPFIADAFSVLNRRITRDALHGESGPVAEGGTDGGYITMTADGGGGGSGGGSSGFGSGSGGGGGGAAGSSGGGSGGDSSMTATSSGDSATSASPSGSDSGPTGESGAGTESGSGAEGGADTGGGTGTVGGGGTGGSGGSRNPPEAQLFDADRVIAPDPDDPTAPPYPIFLPDPEMMPYSHTDERQNRIVAFFSIGGGSSDPDRRMVGNAVLPRFGWPGKVERRIRPQLEWGVRRVQLHNPFGRTNLDDPMEADQYLMAKAQGMDWLTEDFTSSMLPVVTGRYTDGEPVEVIAYFGTLLTTPRFKELYEAGKIDEWWARAWASIKPALDAGMSIGFDAVAFAPEDHPTYQFVRNLRDRGVRVYIETWPHHDFDHWAGFNVVIGSPRAKFIERSKKPLPREQVGEVIRIIRPKYKDQTWLEQVDWLKKHTAGLIQGNSQYPAIPVWLMQNAGVHLREVIELSHNYGYWD